jgi:5-methyltetrahydrofolate--homocysteine methyltransferase
MTTTLPAMERTVALLHRELPDCRVVVGGAVLTQEYADRLGADFYAKDAMQSVRIAERVLRRRGD